MVFRGNGRALWAEEARGFRYGLAGDVAVAIEGQAVTLPR